MRKKLFLILLSFAIALSSILLLAGFSLYNKTSAPAVVSAQEEEPAVCDTEIPIGEALEKTLNLYNDIFSQFDVVYQSVNSEIAAVQNAFTAASACDTSVCSPQCIAEDIFDPISMTVYTACINQMCAGEPCNKTTLSSALVSVAAAVSNIQTAKISLDQLTDVNGLRLKEIRDMMEKSRKDFDACIPTTRDIELQRGPTVCGVALSNFWIEDCKSLLNFFCCR